MLACRQDQFAFVMKLIKQNGIDVTSLLPTLDEQDCWCLDQDFEEVTAKLLTRRLWRERGSNSGDIWKALRYWKLGPCSTVCWTKLRQC